MAACQDEIDNLYLQLVRNSALSIERFKEMITVYNCINESHIDVLYNKHIITSMEREELKAMIA